MKNALFAVTLQTIDTGSAWSVRREGSYFRGADKAGAGWWSRLVAGAAPLAAAVSVSPRTAAAPMPTQIAALSRSQPRARAGQLGSEESVITCI